jgi:hypothetical protein
LTNKRAEEEIVIINISRLRQRLLISNFVDLPRDVKSEPILSGLKAVGAGVKGPQWAVQPVEDV